MSLGSFVLRHRAVVLFGLAVATAGGLYAARGLASGVYPEVDFPRIVVVARHGDLPADVVTTELTLPLEQSLVTVLGVRRVRSRTLRGSTEVSLTFVAGTDMEAALQHVESQVTRARSLLPSGTVVDVERLTPTAFPIVTFNLAGPIDPRDLHDLGEVVVRPALSAVPGVGLVRVLGGELREIEVILDPLASSSAHLGPAEVAARIRDATSLGAAGRLEEHAQRVALLVSSEALDLDDIRSIPVVLDPSGAALPLSSIATVEDGATDPTSRVGGPEGETVIVSVSRLPGASTPEVVRGVEAVAVELALSLPPGVTLTPVYDQANLVEESLASVREAILIGIALCLIVLGLSLRDARAGIIAAASIPVVLSATFAVMRWTGASLNLMSLGGMAVAVGLVIDDAIIVVEAIARRLEEGEDPETAARRGLDEIGPAVFGTTVTTIIVFVPLAFVGGIVGEFFAALAIPLTTAVVLSLVVSLTGIPVAAARFLRRREHRAGRFDAVYRRVARFGAERPWIGPALLLAVLALGFVSLTRVESGFLPSMDESAFVLDYFLPPGTSLRETDAVARRLEGILRDVPEVASYSRRTGAELGPAASTAESRGDVMVRLASHADRDRDEDEITSEIRARVADEIPELRVEFVRVLEDVLNDLSGAPHPVEVKIFGEDPAVLARLAGDVAERLGPVEGLVDLYDGVEGDVPTRVLRVDRAAALRAHTTSREILDRVSAALLGVEAATVRRVDRRIGVRVRYPDSVRFDAEALARLPVSLSVAGSVVPLGMLTRTEIVPAPVELVREDLRNVVVVSGATEGRDLGAVVTDVRAALVGLEVPSGYRLLVAGQVEAQDASFRDLSAVAAFGVLLTLLVLVAQFGRARPALVALSTTPFAITGALVTLWATGTALDVSSAMGLVLLVGLEVKAGILLLEVAEEHAKRGVPYLDAIDLACARRIRPIMMTATATLAGVLPLVLEPGAGAEIQRPLAIAVVGGIGLSKFVVLLALPALATAAEGKGVRRVASPTPAVEAEAV